jgi:antirestriction protein
MSHAHDAHGEIDSLADLRDASRERLFTEIGMLRKETQFAEFQTFKKKYEQEILSSRDAIIGMSAEIGELKAQHRIEVQNVRRSMMNTPTWRAGSLVLKPLNLMKKLLRKN